jgi:hypothetical protein
MDYLIMGCKINVSAAKSDYGTRKYPASIYHELTAIVVKAIHRRKKLYVKVI